MIYEGTVPNSLVRINIDVGYIVILNVLKGSHYVLATGFKDNTIFVNDPLHTSTKSYDLGSVVNGKTVIYKVPVSFPIMVDELEAFIL